MSRLNIKKIIVHRFPETRPDGGDWDSRLLGNPNPDVYVAVYENKVKVFDNPDQRFDNATRRNLPLSWDVDVSVRANAEITVQLMDYDVLDADELMAGCVFVPEKDFSTRPEVIALKNIGSSPIELELHVQWES
ncbi:MAG: hypothetical protein RMM53_01915 [Bacteroidia bacterium]|nr:hypothetical protein [Bacteroidia bacterium]